MTYSFGLQLLPLKNRIATKSGLEKYFCSLKIGAGEGPWAKLGKFEQGPLPTLKKGVPKHYAHATPIQKRFMKWVKDRTNIGPEPSFIPAVSRIISLRVPDIMTIKIDEK